MPRTTRHRLRVRYAECDAMGIVFNANYFLYFDVAVAELWRAAGMSYAGMAAGGVDMAVVEATARYFAPARFDDELDIDAGVASIGRTSLVTEYAIRRGDDLLCEGRVAYVFVDVASHTKIEVPADVRAGLA